MLKRLIHKWERRIVERSTNRVIRPFEWGLEFLGDAVAGGGDRAKEALFEFNKRAIADSDNFFKSQPVKDFLLEGDLLTFSSPLQTPYAENNTVYARYFPVPPNGFREDEAERARGRACIVLPQWNSDSEGHVVLCRWLNRLGIAALRLSLPYHDKRMIAGFQRADYMVSANIGRTLQATRQAVLDARAGIDWLVARGYDRLGVAGTSIGSCVSFLLFAHEERLRSGVFNHVSSYFGDVVWEGITTAHVRQGRKSSCWSVRTSSSVLPRSVEAWV